MSQKEETSNSLLVRYQPTLEGDDYTMDAKVESNNSLTVIEAVNFIAKSAGVKCRLLTTALDKGSVIRYYKLEINLEGEEYLAITAFIIKLFRILFTESDFNTDESLLSRLISDKKALERFTQKFKFTEEKIRTIVDSRKIKRCRTNFYKELHDNKSVQAVSFNDAYDYKFTQNTSTEVKSSQFNHFIEDLNGTVDKVDDTAEILISKPALLKGDDSKWSGYYHSKSINFTVNDNEFKTKSQTGLIKFSTGFAIRCRLEYKETYNDKDELKAEDYKVVIVYENYVNNEWNITRAGLKKQVDDAQPNLFDGIFKE